MNSARTRGTEMSRSIRFRSNRFQVSSATSCLALPSLALWFFCGASCAGDEEQDPNAGMDGVNSEASVSSTGSGTGPAGSSTMGSTSGSGATPSSTVGSSATSTATVPPPSGTSSTTPTMSDSVPGQDTPPNGTDNQGGFDETPGATDDTIPPDDSDPDTMPGADDEAAPGVGMEGTDDDMGAEPDSMDPVLGPGVGGDGFYRMEALDRGVVAVPSQGGIYVGWRMFGYEYEPNDANGVSYNVYRDGELIANVTDSTNLLDPDGTAASRYSVALVLGQDEQGVSPESTPLEENFIRIPLDSPGPNHANDASAADLDGDGQYEVILKWEADNGKDNSQSGTTSDVYLDALQLDGTRLWRINLGPNIRAGAHYTQFIVADLDGDGRAEMGVKTAPGTRDGSGEYLSMGPAANDDDSAIYRNGDGYVLSGPEYFTIFDGLTGLELATQNFAVPRGNVGDWGDTYGNRVDRFLATAAWLDDSGLPSVIMARGYYTRTTLTAWNWRDGQLTEHWTYDSMSNSGPYSGQGNHSLSVANVDDDLGQEIIYGAMVVDHDGTAKCSSNMLHGDALHVSDFLPDRPGIEVFGPTENGGKPKWYVYDGNTCEIVSQGQVTDDDVGRGVAADVNANNPGAELWASSGVSLTAVSDGSNVGGTPASINFLAWWNGDELRELEDGNAVTTYDGQVLLQCQQCSSNNGTKSTPTLVADLLGDWREEVVWRESNNSALRIYTTTDVTQRRIYTLMHDPQYRAAISWQNVAYNQPPHPGFFIGAGMPEPPKPDIRTQ